MEQVPTIISTKDLSYLSDMFEWNFVAAKKALHYSNEIKDEALQKETMNVYEMHQKNLDKILEILS